jgi:hypothetical protein
VKHFNDEFTRDLLNILCAVCKKNDSPQNFCPDIFPAPPSALAPLPRHSPTAGRKRSRLPDFLPLASGLDVMQKAEKQDVVFKQNTLLA